MTIKLVEQYSVAHARDWVRSSLQYHGEQCILLQIYHPTKDDPNKLRCPNCADDIYTQGSGSCPICFGTGYFGGVREARRVWALFSDTKQPESVTQRGVWTPDAREIQTEAFPTLYEHDYVARVREWGGSSLAPVPAELEGIYGIGEVTPDSMRTGARFGQAHWDVIGQRAPITKLQHNVKIGDFPIIGQSFPAFTWTEGVDGAPVPVIAPDQQVLVYSPENIRFVATVGDGKTAMFTLIHNLGTRDLQVLIYNTGTGEEVTADVARVNANTVTVGFDPANPPSIDEYRVVLYAQGGVGSAEVPLSITLGDGTTTVFPIHHDFGRLVVGVTVYEISTGEVVYPDVSYQDINTVVVSFQTAPTLNEYQVVIP